MPEQAPGYYRQAIDADPANLPALSSLERINKLAGAWDELLGNLKLKVAALQVPEEVLEARLAVAEVLDLRLERTDEAIEEYRGIQGQWPTELRALKALERLYAQRERWQELFDVLEK